MKIFVTGVNGQLGSDLMRELLKRGHIPVGSDIADSYKPAFEGDPAVSAQYIKCDITDEKSVLDTILGIKPDAIIHCAAWTNVDGAEDEENKPLVYKINVEGTRNMAKAAKAVSAKIIYISTDYVFSGTGDRPWLPDDEPNIPLNYYGETKLGGERAVCENTDKFFIVRIAWVFGKNGNNFIKTMLKLSEKYDSLRVVDDQIGTPTYTFDLARLLVDMIETEKYGFYHATNSGGYISWCDFAKEIFRQAGIKMEVNAVTTAEYGQSKAKRAENSRLDKSKLTENGFELLPPWQDAVSRYLKEIGVN